MRERERGALVVERLRRRSDFRAAAKGLRASACTFVLQARPRPEGGPVRVGFTVSRQVGSAVERNRVRRRLREMIRLSIAGGACRLRQGHDYVLIARRAALAAPFAEMMRAFEVAIGRIEAAERRDRIGDAPSERLNEARPPPKPPERPTAESHRASSHSRFKPRRKNAE